MVTSLTKAGPNYNPDFIDFAKEGAVFVAPVGTVEPTGLPDLDVALLLVHLLLDAVRGQVSEVDERVRVGGQAGGKIKEWIKSRTFTFGFTMMARSIDTVSVFYGIPKDQFTLVPAGTNPATPAYYEWTDGGAPALDERFFAIDYITGAGKSHERILIPRGTFSERGSITLNRDDTIKLEGKITAQVNALGYSLKRRATGLVVPTP